MGANAITSLIKIVNGNTPTGDELTFGLGGIPVFATTVTRDAAFGGANEKVLAQGQLCYLESTNVVQQYSGSVWQTVGPATPGALVLLQTLSPSAVASAQFTDGILTSVYDNYFVAFELNTAAGASVLCQLRNAGATISAANYRSGGAGLTELGGTMDLTQSGATSFILGYADASNQVVGRLDAYRPSASKRQALTCITASINAALSAYGGRSLGYQYTAAQIFDSLIFTTGSTMTGSIRLYGLQKS